ncbi:hypothetical protein lerEdw1_003616 [Lerista edwardsae]|nr:hypothetical protein lerEdw1_003616 [Lerista edwardsae]
MGLWKGLFVVFAWSLAATAVAQRVPANTVLYECNRTSIHLVVRIDPWGTGLKLAPEFLHLGSCPVSLENSRLGVFQFQYSLKECGFVRMRTHRRVEYSVNLVYGPPSQRGRFHRSPFSERINCTDYEVEHQTPARLSSFTGQLSASSVLMFTVALMNEDFSGPSDSTLFLLGSQIHLEFAVQRFSHQPLRVFVDQCIAAATPELSRSPRNYSIIANHGCLVDGKAANSRFLPRPTPEVLRLSLQAFEFVGVSTDIYLHCRVFVWDPNVLTDPSRKACSFQRDTSRWENLDDSSSTLCSCCDSECQAAKSRRKRDLEGPLAEDELPYNVVVFTIRKLAHDVGSLEQDSNHSDSKTASLGGKLSVMPPAVGALLLEVGLAAVLSVGFCFYNGYQKRLCLCHRGAAALDTEGLLEAGQTGHSVNADVE